MHLKYIIKLFITSSILIVAFYLFGAKFWAKYNLFIILISLMIFLEVGKKLINECSISGDNKVNFWTYFKLVSVPLFSACILSLCFMYFFANYIDPNFFNVEVVEEHKKLLNEKDTLFTNYQGKDYLDKIFNNHLENKYGLPMMLKRGINFLFLISIMVSILAFEKKK